MSGYDDDAREMGATFGFDDDGGNRDAATGAAVAQFIDDLRSLGEADPPEPTAELAAVLQGGPVPRAGRVATGRKRLVVAVAASLLVGGTGVAAANGRLPQPAQRLVSDVVDNLTPFSVPAKSDPDVPSGPGPTPAHDRVVVPPPVVHPRHPQPRGSESEPGDSAPGGSDPSGSESDGRESGGGVSGGGESGGGGSGGADSGRGDSGGDSGGGD